jgi:hypothetical protein
MTDVLKIAGVNGSVLAVSLTEVEVLLKIILLAMSICWTCLKIRELIKEK